MEFAWIRSNLYGSMQVCMDSYTLYKTCMDPFKFQTKLYGYIQICVDSHSFIQIYMGPCKFHINLHASIQMCLHAYKLHTTFHEYIHMSYKFVWIHRNLYGSHNFIQICMDQYKFVWINTNSIQVSMNPYKSQKHGEDWWVWKTTRLKGYWVGVFFFFWK